MGGSLADYMRSLERLQELDLTTIYPGHGPEVTDPEAKIAEYIEHRMMRERRLVAALERGERSKAALLAEVWDDVPEQLRGAAAIAMQAHLEKLEDEAGCPPTCGTEPLVAPWYEGRMSFDLGRVLRAGASGLGIGTALLGVTAAGLWWQLFRRHCRKPRAS